MIDESIDTILLHTNDGSKGYRIVDFQAIGSDPGNKTYEVVLKIFTTPQTATPTGDIDFNDQELIAVLYYLNNPATDNLSEMQILYDNMVFNQDLYITCQDSHNTPSTADVRTNYQLKLEQVSLDLNENTVATLKDIRNIAQ